MIPPNDTLDHGPPPTICQTTRENHENGQTAVQTLDGQHAVPIYYQSNPSPTSRYHKQGITCYSATESRESRNKWAFKNRCILDEQHKTHEPQYEGVIKFFVAVTLATLKRFLKRCREQLAYWVRTNGVEFAIFYSVEIEKSNLIHLHCLIRTNVPYPRSVLSAIVEKASDRQARVQHCEKIESVAAISRYSLKDLDVVRNGKKEILLFKRGLGLRQIGSWNGYFTKPKSQLWAEWKHARYPPATAAVDESASAQAVTTGIRTRDPPGVVPIPHSQQPIKMQCHSPHPQTIHTSNNFNLRKNNMTTSQTSNNQDAIVPLEDELEREEKRIETSFHAMLEAITRIHDEKLYIGSFTSFETYCQERWGITRQRAHQLITAGKLLATMSTIVDKQRQFGGQVPAVLPTNEAQLRELARCSSDPDIQFALWSATVSAAAAKGQQPTAELIRQKSFFLNPELSVREQQERLIVANFDEGMESLRVFGNELIKIRDSKTYPTEYKSIHEYVMAKSKYERWMVDLAIDLAEERKLSSQQIADYTDKLIALSDAARA